MMQYPEDLDQDTRAFLMLKVAKEEYESALDESKEKLRLVNEYARSKGDDYQAPDFESILGDEKMVKSVLARKLSLDFIEIGSVRDENRKEILLQLSGRNEARQVPLSEETMSFLADEITDLFLDTIVYCDTDWAVSVNITSIDQKRSGSITIAMLRTFPQYRRFIIDLDDDITTTFAYNIQNQLKHSKRMIEFKTRLRNGYFHEVGHIIAKLNCPNLNTLGREYDLKYRDTGDVRYYDESPEEIFCNLFADAYVAYAKAKDAKREFNRIVKLFEEKKSSDRS